MSDDNDHEHAMRRVFVSVCMYGCVTCVCRPRKTTRETRAEGKGSGGPDRTCSNVRPYRDCSRGKDDFHHIEINRNFSNVVGHQGAWALFEHRTDVGRAGWGAAPESGAGRDRTKTSTKCQVAEVTGDYAPNQHRQASLVC